MITLEQLRKNEEIRAYIEQADRTLGVLGYTEHSYAHVGKVAETAGSILETLGYSAHEVELAKIAGYLHDIGNLVNRVEHAQSGATMAFAILRGLNMDPKDLAVVVSAIANHDESVGEPVDPVAAALILADKTDVRRSRVRNEDKAAFDIHDRVNYSVKQASLKINESHTNIKLKLHIDTKYGSIMDYFEIFLHRMNLCRRAARKLGLEFKLIINEQTLL